jgi:hypothetical protein
MTVPPTRLNRGRGSPAIVGAREVNGSNLPRRTEAANTLSLGSAVRSILSHRGVHITFAVWILGMLAAMVLARGSLPFDRPAVAQLPFAAQLVAPNLIMIEVFGLMALVFLLTRKRRIPDMADRAPERRIAARETLLVLGYAALGQVGGWIVGVALGYRPFSFHIAGSVYGCSIPPGRAEVCVWALYNFFVFAAVPYVCFRRRYSNTELNLRSDNRKSDAVVILVVLAIESAFELAAFTNNVFRLSSRQALIGAPLTFAVFLVGTVLPTMILIYSILLPRFLKLTGSAISTVLLGGLTYAGMHIVEGWSAFNSPRNAALSLLFVVFQYFGPGLIKSVLTLRTGNAWVHALSYHAVAPHVLVDTPLIVKVFGLA